MAQRRRLLKEKILLEENVFGNEELIQQVDESKESLLCSSMDKPYTELKTGLRLVLLGGDPADNCYACTTILRSSFKDETNNSRKGNFRKSIVEGRKVSVFRTPAYWIDHLHSYWIFNNAVKSIRNEIQNCTSRLFPGPHAFLLVMRDGHSTGKEKLLLDTITSVFGSEALEYTMVVFIYADECSKPAHGLENRCVQMCGKRCHTLGDSIQSVESLFTKVEEMVKNKKSSFFLQTNYENLMKECFEGWISQETKQLEKELETSRQHERQLAKELNEFKKENSELQGKIEEYKDRERELKLKLRDAETKEEYARETIKSEVMKVTKLMLGETRLREQESQKQDLQANGLPEAKMTRARLRSCDYLPPEMPVSQSKVLDDL